MKRILVSMMMINAMVNAATVYVAPDGADSHAGTREAPFRTLAKARDALRNAPGDGGAMRAVVLGGGIYRLTETFELDARDANTTYRAKGVGQIVSNNHLHDAPHNAILFEGNDHQMTFNHIERVCLDTSDAGAIYCGRDWTMGGNRIHGNYIHHLGRASHHQNWAIYLDDMAAGIEVSGNVVADTDAAMLIGGGRSNVITDNLIIRTPRIPSCSMRGPPAGQEPIGSGETEPCGCD